jgi:hypothetical protein
LIVQEFLTSAEFGCIAKIKDIADMIHTQPLQLELWRTFSKVDKLIEQNVVTRWNSTKRMLEDAIKCKYAVTQFSDHFNLDVTDDDWKMITHILLVLERFEKETLLVSQSRPTMTESLRVYFRIHNMFATAELIANGRQDQIKDKHPLKKLCTEVASELVRPVVADKFFKYYEKILEIEPVYVSSILDPRYKDHQIKQIQKHAPEDNQSIQQLLNKIKNDISERVKQAPESQETQIDPVDDNYDIFEDEIPLVSDIEKYLSDCRIADSPTFNLTRWWKESGVFMYPTLAPIARQFLSIPSSSACVERLFNMGRDQYKIRRSRLSAESLQKLIVLQQKMRNARKKNN